jgi:hypothetical protein
MGISMASTTDKAVPTDLEPPRRPLTPAAARALAEAEARRREASDAGRAKEVGGRDGPEPVRYGDWEKGGICWDF